MSDAPSTPPELPPVEPPAAPATVPQEPVAAPPPATTLPDPDPPTDDLPTAPVDVPQFATRSTPLDTQPLPLELREKAAESPSPAAPPQPTISPQRAAQPVPFGAGTCPRCGGTDFGDGELITYGSRFRPAFFMPGRLSIRRLHWLGRPFRKLAKVEAQVCRECGLVMFQVDTERLRRIEGRRDT